MTVVPMLPPRWTGRLTLNDKDKIIPTLANALIIFTNDPDLKGLLAFNEFTCRAVLMRSPPPTEGLVSSGPFPRAWEAADEALCLSYMQRMYSSQFTMNTIVSAMTGVSIALKFHPIRKYLESLVWDGIYRVGRWLVDAFGANDDEYHKAVGSKFLAAAVRRVKQPGCKFDSIPIFEGFQDIGKSRACRELFGDQWFSDNLPTYIASKDMSDALQGLWCAEFAEIEHLLRSEPETIKAFLSRQVDRYRPVYGRTTVERPRQGVLVGTTNNDDYARDSTGNRRLWPIMCHFADADWLKANRDQLWAEAVQLEPGMKLWLEDVAVRETAKCHQAARHDEDPWEDGILSWLVGRTNSVTVPMIMDDHLYLSKDKQNKSGQMRIAKVLKRAGWSKSTGGVLGRRWLPPNHLDP